MLQKCFHTKVSQSRSKKYRSKLTFTHKLLIKVSTCTIQKLNLIQKLCFLLRVHHLI